MALLSANTGFPSESAYGQEDKLRVLREMTIDHGAIVSVEHQAAPEHNLPPHTIVKARLNPAKGSNINVEIRLPDAEKWNDRFLGQGNGGAAGHINPDTFTWGLHRGFAVGTTDMGTAPNPDSGIGNREVWKDFGYRATHLMTVCSKQIVEAYYGRVPSYSYFVGGSTGGQQALQEAQRYPEDYDGIVANVPALCRTPLHAYFLWNFQVLHRCHFSDAQLEAITAAGAEYMAKREAPVLAGKLVSDPRITSQDIEAVVSLIKQKDPTLTSTQTDGLRKLFDGPRNAKTGERIFGGIPLGSSLHWVNENLYLFHWVFGGGKDLNEINFSEDMDTYTAALGPYLNAENPDLSRFKKRGGKLVMMAGTADSIVPYHATVDYYERVIECSGGLENAQSFIRFYVVPGMDHGMGGTHPQDPVELMIAWRENGVEPGMIHANRAINGTAGLEIPLYPYPTQTGWSSEKQCFIPVEGKRGGVDRVAERYRPAAAE